jgi:mono/diheme cytochrome c family protein
MPVWGEMLSEQQINDVVAYINTLLQVPLPE